VIYGGVAEAFGFRADGLRAFDPRLLHTPRGGRPPAPERGVRRDRAAARRARRIDGVLQAGRGGGRPPEETAGHALAEARDRPLRGLGSRAEPGRREVPGGEQGHARQRQPLHSRGRPLPQSADQGDGRVQERPPLGGLGVRRRADGGRGEVVEPLPRGRLRVGAKTRPKRTPSSSRRRSGRSQVCRAATVSPTRRSRCSASSTDRRTSESGSTF